MEQKILRDWQKKVLDAVFSLAETEQFYLTGGTALAAFYLSHRFSDDLDFFSDTDFDTNIIYGVAQGLTKIIGAQNVRYSRLYDRRQFFYTFGLEEVKVEFARYPFAPLEHFVAFNGYRVDSERDIAANKLMAMLDRFDPKDFVDLFFLLKKFSLAQVRQDAEQKFKLAIDPIFLGGEISKVRRVAALPKMAKPLTVEELHEFFSNQAKILSGEIVE